MIYQYWAVSCHWTLFIIKMPHSLTQLEVYFAMSTLKVLLTEYMLLINYFNKIKLNTLSYHCVSSFAVLIVQFKFFFLVLP